MDLVIDPQYYISIVIPTYNRCQYISAVIASVLRQTYRNFEIIVVDDGSTDDTARVLEGLAAGGTAGADAGPQIRYFFQTNSGPSAARNRGIAEAAGNWIAFLDSDDLWLPDKLERQIRAVAQFHGECGACFTDARLVDSRGLDIGAFARAGWHFDRPTGRVADLVRRLARAFGGYWMQTLLARTDFVRKAGGFDPDLHFGEDYDFLFRLALIADHCYVNCLLAVIDRTTTLIDRRAAPRRWDHVDFRLRARQYMYEKWLRLTAQSSDELREIIIDNLLGVHSGWANWHLENRQFGEARRAALTALRYRITPRLAVKWGLACVAPRIARKLVPTTASIL